MFLVLSIKTTIKTVSFYVLDMPASET